MQILYHSNSLIDSTKLSINSILPKNYDQICENFGKLCLMCVGRGQDTDVRFIENNSTKSAAIWWKIVKKC